MLDLDIIARIKVDDGYEELRNSARWEHRQVADYPRDLLGPDPYFDAVVMRLYDENGEVEDEWDRLHMRKMKDHSDLPTVLDNRKVASMWTSSSPYVGADTTSSGTVQWRDYDDGRFALMTCLNFIFLPPALVTRPMMVPHFSPAMMHQAPEWRVLLLVYESIKQAKEQQRKRGQWEDAYRRMALAQTYSTTGNAFTSFTNSAV